MASVYDSAKLNNSKYVSQFVGSTNDELLNVGKVLDKRFRDNKDYADKVAMTLAQEQYNTNDQAIKDRHINNIKDVIGKVSASPENFENSSAVISNLARDTFSDPARIAALENFKLAEKDRELERQGYNLNFGDNRDTHQTVNPETGQVSRFNLNREKRGDYSGRMQQLLGKVADDGYFIDPTGQKQTFDETERYLIKTSQVNKISKQKLDNLVEGLIPSYKSSTEGEQDLRRLTQLEGVPDAPVKVPITNKKGKIVGYQETNALDEDIRQRFRAIAYPQQFTNTTQRIEDFGLSAAERAKQAAAQAESYFTGDSPGNFQDNSTLDPIPDLDTIQDQGAVHDLGNGNFGYYEDRNGNKVPKSELPTPLSGSTGIAQALAQQQANDKGYKWVEANQEQIESDLKYKFDQVKNASPGLYNNFEDFKESYKSAVKNHRKITPTGNDIAPNQAENYDDYVNRVAATNALYPTVGSEPQSLEQLAEKIGTSPSKIKLKAIKTYYDSPNKSLPGGYIEARVEVSDSKVDKHPSTVLIPLNNQFVGLSEPIDHLYKSSFYQGRDSYSLENPYFPEPGGQPMVNGNTQLGFYTTTTPIPKAQQKAGQPAFKTVVHPVIKRANASGGVDIMPRTDERGNEETMTIGRWKQEMIKTYGPQFKNALNSGQTFNAKDVKESGVDY